MTPLTTPSPFLVGEIVLVDLLALFLSVVTVSIRWYVVKKIFPDGVKDLQSFLTFIVAVVPFVMIIYFGLAVIRRPKSSLCGPRAGLSGSDLAQISQAQ
jgi:hypothetical protein